MTDIESRDPAARTAPLIAYDPADAATAFGRAPFGVRHGLADHPLFSLDALADLADRLPADVVEHNLGNVGAVVPGGEVPALDQTPGELVRGIETNGCWVVLPIRIPTLQAPGYEDVYEELVDCLSPMVEGGRGAMSGYHGVIFLASSGSTTPAHVDHETGFLLHIRGPKRMSVGRFRDEATEDRELEAFFAGGHRNTSELPVDVENFDLEPGHGVHVPPLTPHWVTNGDGVTISLNVGFQTEAALRRAGAYKFNARARRLGLRPARPGRRPAADRAKASAVWAARDLVRKLDRSGR